MKRHHLKKCGATSLILVIMVGMLALPNAALAAYSASDVLGQPDFTSNTPNNNPLTIPNKYGFNQHTTPEDGLQFTALDPIHHRLFVSDTGNNRILEFDLDGNNEFLDRRADHVLGQQNFHSNTGATTQSGIYYPRDIAYDGVHDRLFVADRGNNLTAPVNSRVLVFDVAAITDGENAINVIGEPNFTSGDQTASINGIAAAFGVAYDPTNDRLFVADTNANRVVVFDVDPAVLVPNDPGSDGPDAINVIGQADFDGNQNNGTNSRGVSNPYTLVYDSNNDRLFVTDTNGNRVMVFDVDPSVLVAGDSGTDFPAAINELGQPNFTTIFPGITQQRIEAPVGVTYDSINERLFVALPSNRVLVFDVDPGVLIANNAGTDGPAAINVIGQTDFTSQGQATTQDGLHYPVGLAYDTDNGQLFVSDGFNNRLMVFDADPGTLIANNSGTDGPAAIDAAGQVDENGDPVYTTSAADNQDNSPFSIVGDQGLQTVQDVVIDTVGHRLFVADSGNSRVLEFDLDSDNNLVDHTADHVLGQDTFETSDPHTTQDGLNNPIALTYDATNHFLFVADYNNNRVIVFDVDTIIDGEDAVHVLGHTLFDNSDTPSNESKLDGPAAGLTYDDSGQRLFVSDSGNNRVMVFDLSGGITDGMDAAHILGHTQYDGGDSPTGQNGLNFPQGLVYDGAGGRLFVVDGNNSRVMVFDVTSIIDGEDAAHVLGQNTFNDVSGAASQSGLQNPIGVAYDIPNHLLFVGDSGNSRVMVFDVTTIGDGEDAVTVVGQDDFNSSGGDTTQDTLSGPEGMAYDSTNNRLYVADSGNNRVMIFNLVAVSPNTLPDGAVGTFYDQTISADNAQGTVTFAVTAGSVPTGLSLDGSTGELSGTPSAEGVFSFTVTATDDISPAGAFTDSQDYTLTIIELAHTDITTSGISFGTNGTVFSAIIGDDGNTYVGGSFSQVGATAVRAATFNTDTGSFIAGGDFDGTVRVAVADGAGGWYVGGDFTSVRGEARNRLVHILSTGSVDPDFDPNVNAVVSTLLLDGTTLYAGGSFTDVNGGTTRNYLAAFDTATGIATAFDPDLDSAAIDLALDGTTLYVGGAFTDVNGGTARSRVAAFDTTTSIATAFDPNVGGIVVTIALDGTTLYVGGSFTDVNGGTTRNNLAAFNTTTSIATAFDPNLNDIPSDLVPDGTTLYVSGDFTDVNGGTTRNHLAAFNTTTSIATAFDPNINATANVLVLDGTTLYAGGFFTSVNGGTTRNRLAAFDTTSPGTATSFDPDLNNNVLALALDGTTLYAGGNFTLAGVADRNNLASFVTTTGEVTDLDPNINGTVRALLLDGTTLYVGGIFTDVNSGTTRNHLAAFDTATSIATAFDPNMDINVYALALDGTTLYAGGDFTDVNGGTTRNSLAAFDTTTSVATSFDPSVTSGSGVYTLVLDGTTLYAGGFFDTVNGSTTRNSLAAFDTTTSIATSFDPDMNSDVYALLLDGTTLYVGGDFDTVNGGTARNYLAALDTTTPGTATSFDPNVETRVWALALDGTTLYAGGEFTNVNGGTARNHLAALDITTSIATDFNPNINNTVYALSLGDDHLAVGGSFTMVGSLPRSRFAMFDIGASPTPTPTPTATPTPTPGGGGGGTPGGPGPSSTPAPSGSPTPNPSGSPSPSVSVSPGVTPTGSPIPSGSPLSPTPGPSSSPAPSAGPTPSSLPSGTPPDLGPIFSAIGSGISSVISFIATAIPKVVGVVVERVAPVGAPVVALAVAIPVIIAAVVAAATTGSPVSFALSQSKVLLEVIGLKRRRRIWGTIYDSRTKRPIPYAKVELYDQNRRLLETRYADRDGRYGFLTSPQSLRQGSITVSIVPSAPQYQFPSTVVTKDSDFIVYDHLYRGGSVAIAKDSLVNYNIALDPTQSHPVPVRTRVPGILGSLIVTLLDVFFWVGLILLPLNAFFHPSVLSIGLLALFLISNGIRITSDLYRPYGLTTDQAKQVVPYALITLNEPNGTRKSFAVSDEQGRYFLIADPGSYMVTTHTPAQVQPPRSTSVLLTTKKGWIRRRLSL